MKREITTSSTNSGHILSEGVVANGFIFVSGQIHADADLKLVSGSTKAKLDQIMRNISEVLTSAGATLDDIVKVVIYVTDMSVMPELNEIYPTYFTKPLPVREAVCVKALPLGADIEISVIAAKA